MKRLQTVGLSGKDKTMKTVKINGCKVSGKGAGGERQRPEDF